MQEGTDSRSVVHSLRTDGGGAASHVTEAHRGSSHMFPQRRAMHMLPPRIGIG